MTIAERIGRQKGRQQGLHAGMQTGLYQGRRQCRQEDILTVLQVRFDDVPHAVEKRIMAIQDPERLAALLRKAVVVREMRAFADDIE